MRLLRTTGVQPEAQLPFAGLHQLVLPVPGQADRLPTQQRAALLAAFGMAEAAEAPDRLLIALAVLELLTNAAKHAPLVVVAEAAHWLHSSTADVLAFVARRVEHEPIVYGRRDKDIWRPSRMLRQGKSTEPCRSATASRSARSRGTAGQVSRP